MKYKPLGFFYIWIILLAIGCGQSKEKKIPEENAIYDSYKLVEDWPNLTEDYILGMPTGLGIDSESNIVVFHRAGRPWSFPPPEEKIKKNTILTIDRETGKILKSWGSDLFLMPHGLEIDRDNNIWVTDVGLQQILKFNQDGELVRVIGEATILGNDSIHFSLPTDVAGAPDGSFYVSDGYGNSRVVKYSKDNSFLFEWGKNGPDYKLNRGDNEGEFNTPHGIDLDKNMNVYIADRENNRIQKFDSEGNFIAVWQNKSAHQLYSVAVDHKNNHLLAIDYDSIAKASKIFRFDLDLNLDMQFNNPNTRYHDIAIDNEGTIYVGDIAGSKIQKFLLVKSE
ncbi:MAG: peptidyl-alpha-hydroxyglycine alpha-amidating lyase family protein [Eudoraea sp.]|jgi:peptidylamidoglycolate lyase|uniref:peptidyl-alpha-hydroxyglycine alpha-amidating lyase family protein n=1 Tax=Eudoraea sp. TaxID=1979955 RepID=UPI003C739470